MTRERSRKAVKKEITNDMVPIDDLVPYAKNARKHPEKQIEALCKSIAAFGFVNPVSVWKGNELIAGHGRVIAAKRLLETGKAEYAYLSEIPVRRCDHLSNKERRALALADNQIALQAEWDDDLLQEELADLVEEDIDISMMGFDASDIVMPEDEELQDGVQTNAEMSQETVDAANTQAVIGPYRIPIPREVFLKWEEEIRQSVGFDKQDIIKEIKKRLKLKC